MLVFLSFVFSTTPVYFKWQKDSFIFFKLSLLCPQNSLVSDLFILTHKFFIFCYLLTYWKGQVREQVGVQKLAKVKPVHHSGHFVSNTLKKLLQNNLEENFGKRCQLLNIFEESVSQKFLVSHFFFCFTYGKLKKGGIKKTKKNQKPIFFHVNSPIFRPLQFLLFNSYF